ncbi:alpha-amylase family protein [Shewanella holmiensis]|uniref:Alpha-amylase family protein n=1 Tax=Shewanella holmiensis TaxID=2952222 RepID=A0A9X2WPW3_9GAMM|nr:alpha-amylase family protein [Shewanella holmiensis]MCT7942867.1 alpha-amylase family protein [Shewanella holmiensis]
MMKKIKHNHGALLAVIASLILSACSESTPAAKTPTQPRANEQHTSQLVSVTKESVKQDPVNQAPQNTLAPALAHKAVVYQVFTRLYGNTKTLNKPWGTLAENGVGKFSDFTDAALQDIKSLGTTHIWYTGVPHHALINDYTNIDISNDDPDVVKGRAGSPYAVKDYYNVNPDLADVPANRLAEFEALIARTHQHGMKVIIDIVPNHVARNYQTLATVDGAENFGANDDKTQVYAKDNNFYYVVGEDFQVPDANNGVQPLNGEPHPLSDGMFSESPAKWTGNGSRLAKPAANDWYETVKINYGVKPDGSYDFPALPNHFDTQPVDVHYTFWQSQQGDSIPDSWKKFAHITQYWLAKGVDGFRYDMAEMVPVEFWSYLNSQIKHTNPQAFLLAEVYNPSLYRAYIQQGKMDYLYDKVDLYDTLKAIIQDKASTAQIATVQAKVADIEAHMLHFLENHDEQRINTQDFATTPEAALPAMVVSTTLSRSPTLLYFGQDVGEAAADNAGFGQATRTSIFDYIGVPAHQRWMNNGKFDGGQSTEQEKALRQYYQRLLNLSHTASALKGEYQELDSYQRNNNVVGYTDKVFAFTRFDQQQQLIIVSNFSSTTSSRFDLVLPQTLTQRWQISANINLTDLLSDSHLTPYTLQKHQDSFKVNINLAPLQSVVLALP